MIKIVNIVGARPNFVKIAPFQRAMDSFNKKRGLKLFSYKLVHTGQHYDYKMSQVFFQDLKMPKPHFYLGVGSCSHVQQIANIMSSLEPILLKYKPHLMAVVGDVNSTLAAALTASKLNIFVAHIEAGLRSFDRTMPEEANRILTDHLADFLFTPSKDADGNLQREGIPKKKIFRVGNIMIDSLKDALVKSKNPHILQDLNLQPKQYAILTLHRPSNVDVKQNFQATIKTLKKITKAIPLIFPAHPRTKKTIQQFGFMRYFEWDGNKKKERKNLIQVLPPLGYIDFVGLLRHAAFVITDSGGIQEEASVLKVPCLTVRNTTERPITITHGTNTVLGRDSQRLLLCVEQILRGEYLKRKSSRRIPLWDGRAARRIVHILAKKLC